MRARHYRKLPFVLAAALAVLACGDDIAGPHPPELDDLKADLSQYQNLSTAQAAGWDAKITPCWFATGAGGMGYHFGNTDLIDGTPSLDNPEAFMYEPQKDGSMKLVGLEYIVPISAWTGDGPPFRVTRGTRIALACCLDVTLICAAGGGCVGCGSWSG